MQTFLRQIWSILALSALAACTNSKLKVAVSSDVNGNGASVESPDYNASATVKISPVTQDQTVSLSNGDLAGFEISAPKGSLPQNSLVTMSIKKTSETDTELSITSSSKLSGKLSVVLPTLMTTAPSGTTGSLCLVSFRKASDDSIDKTWKGTCGRPITFTEWGSVIVEWATATDREIVFTNPTDGVSVDRASDGVSLSLQGSCRHEGLVITLTFDGSALSVLPVCTSSAWSTIVSIKGSGSSTHTLKADGKLSGTAFGSAASISFTVTAIGAKPKLSITTPSSDGTYVNSANTTAFTLAGVCSAFTQSVKMSGALTGQTTCQTDGTWTITADISSLADGTLTFAMNMTDAQGRTALEVSRSIVKFTSSATTATGLGWAQATPYNSTSLTANWTAPTGSNTASQSLQFYRDAYCATTVGSAISLSSSASSYAFTASGDGSYEQRHIFLGRYNEI